jgi:hypothetical protein
LILLLPLSTSTSAQQTDTTQQTDSTKTLFGPETKIGFVWSVEVKINSIQDKTGSLISVYGGALVNRSVLLGLAIGANVGHPTVNYSYLGFITQYTYKPKELLHVSAQVLVSIASTKDYERSKSSLFDNFLNTSGASFYFVEPGINLGLNLSSSVRLVSGLSYRFAFGLDENSPHVAKTQVTNSELSGINFILGVKFGEY